MTVVFTLYVSLSSFVNALVCKITWLIFELCFRLHLRSKSDPKSFLLSTLFVIDKLSVLFKWFIDYSILPDMNF